MKTLSEIEAWLVANKGRITHFRPRKWCGVAQLLAYDCSRPVPYIDGQPEILDCEEHAEIIRRVLGAGFIEERFAGLPGSNNY